MRVLVLIDHDRHSHGDTPAIFDATTDEDLVASIRDIFASHTKAGYFDDLEEELSELSGDGEAPNDVQQLAWMTEEQLGALPAPLRRDAEQRRTRARASLAQLGVRQQWYKDVLAVLDGAGGEPASDGLPMAYHLLCEDPYMEQYEPRLVEVRGGA